MGTLQHKIKTAKSQLQRDVYTTEDSMLLLEVPPPPETLNETGIFWWDYYCGLCIEAKILSRFFIGTIQDVCHLRQMIEEFEQKIHEQGVFIQEIRMLPKHLCEDPSQREYVYETENPLIKTLQRLYGQFSDMASLLGWNPYSARVNSIDASGGSSPENITEPPSTDFEPPISIPMVS